MTSFFLTHPSNIKPIFYEEMKSDLPKILRDIWDFFAGENVLLEVDMQTRINCIINGNQDTFHRPKAPIPFDIYSQSQKELINDYINRLKPLFTSNANNIESYIQTYIIVSLFSVEQMSKSSMHTSINLLAIWFNLIWR